MLPGCRFVFYIFLRFYCFVNIALTMQLNFTTTFNKVKIQFNRQNFNFLVHRSQHRIAIKNEV